MCIRDSLLYRPTAIDVGTRLFVTGLVALMEESSSTVTQLTLSASSDKPQTVRPGRSIRPVKAVVTDSLGQPLVGVSVTYSTGTTGATFVSCSCSSETVTTGAKGKVSSGLATAPLIAGPGVITASTADTVAPPATYAFTVR